METFKRYLIHFFLITLMSAIILFVLMYTQMLLKVYLLCFFIVLVTFVIPMSLFFSRQESTITIKIQSDSEIVYEQICEVIEKNINRTPISHSDNKLVFTIPAGKINLLTKYKRWLTNDISVTKCDSTIEIVTPRCFQNHFSIFNKETTE